MRLRRRHGLFLIVSKLAYRYEGTQRKYFFEVTCEEKDENKVNKLVDIVYKLVNEGNIERFLSGSYKVKLSI